MKEPVKKGYWMLMVDVTDEANYPKYIAANKAAFDKYGESAFRHRRGSVRR